VNTVAGYGKATWAKYFSLTFPKVLAVIMRDFVSQSRNELSKGSRGDYVDIFNLMDDLFNDGLPSTRVLRNDTFKIDVRNKEEKYIVDAELPGFTKDEIQLDMNEETLSISASKSEDSEDKKGSYIHRERKSTSVKRSIYLKDIDLDNIKASFEMVF
jgi:HSP20 family protein